MDNLKLSLNGDLEELSILRKSAADFIGGDLSGADKNRVILSLDEAAANIIIHGCSRAPRAIVEIEMKRKPGTLTFILTDNGPPFNPLEQPEPDMDEYASSERHGGLGVYIYKKFMDASYERDLNGFNRLTLIKGFTDEN